MKLNKNIERDPLANLNQVRLIWAITIGREITKVPLQMTAVCSQADSYRNDKALGNLTME